MTITKIIDGNSSHYLTLIDIWQASVEATHHFLSEADINALRPLILEHYFDAVQLKCAVNAKGHIVGFIGVAQGNIEMLFVAPNTFGQGIGSLLTRHAITNLDANKVDVNEQNPSALGFYQQLGFSVNSRSPLDGQGRPFPLLHMQLSEKISS